MAKPTSNPKIAIAYLRVSTDRQELGPEAQRASIDAWARAEGVTIAAWHIDRGVSGGADVADRPALVAALADLRTNSAGLLVVAKRDRLARDPYIAGAVERAAKACGAVVASCDGANGDTPADQFMRAILDAAAAHERALIRARVKAALAVKKARGERVGRPRFGYRLGPDGATLVPVDGEQAVIDRVRELRGAGVPLKAIVEQLAAEGLRSRRGKLLAMTQVHRIARAA